MQLRAFFCGIFLTFLCKYGILFLLLFYGADGMRISLFVFIVLIVLFGNVLCGCAPSNRDFRQKNFGYDTNYFLGLQNVRDGNAKEAARHFEICVKKGTKYCARKSDEELLKIGNLRERVEKSISLYEKYNDEDSLMQALRVLKDASETNKIISITNGVDLKTCSNYVASQRLDALEERGDSRFVPSHDEWFLMRPFSQEHYTYFCRKKNSENPLVDFRAMVYRRDYRAAYAKYVDLGANGTAFPLEEQLLSDLGKAFLYSGQDCYLLARIFDGFSARLEGRLEQFYAYFYAARLYEKAGSYFSLALNRYNSAMDSAMAFADDEKYDNALWYLLHLQLKKSTQSGIEAIKSYIHTLKNPEYFEDHFATLAPILLNEHRWNDFYDVYKAIEKYASDETVSHYAYISGRLFQEGLLTPAVGIDKEFEAERAFTRALSSGSETYYRVMALFQLGLGEEREEEVLCSGPVAVEGDVDKDAERLLEGYAAFGFPEKIYPEFMNFYTSGVFIGVDSATRLSNFLRDCGESQNEYYPQALRIMSRVVVKANRGLTKEDLKLFFPKNYRSLVETYCEEYNLPQENMYALIRSESFFDSKVYSSVGAVGLTQLMKETAGDVAKKLKVDEFDLHDAETNIRFGSYYLAELNRRLDGEWLPTFFAYNAGISRVRRWIKDSKITFPVKGSVPYDILLEIIPYEETRGYGRKLVGATAMYAWLYDGEPICDVVKRLMGR